MATTCPTYPASAYGRPLLQVAKELGVHIATTHRWRTVGVLGAGGIRRRLTMTRIGERWYVRDADLSDFFAALAATEGDSTVTQSSPVARRKDAERASAELDAIGI